MNLRMRTEHIFPVVVNSFTNLTTKEKYGTHNLKLHNFSSFCDNVISS